MKRRAFTLIELLIVVAIIGVLAALLMPSITKGIERARQTKCANNLRQLFVAMNMYAQDHDGIIVHNLNNPNDDNSALTSNWNWVQSLGPYVEKIASANGKRHSGIWACPVSKNKASGGDLSDYVKNYYVNGDQSKDEWHGPHNRNLKMISISQPSKVIALTDNSANNNRDLHEWNTDWGIGYRHDKRANIVYYDGHGEAVKQAGLTFDSSKLPWSPNVQ